MAGLSLQLTGREWFLTDTGTSETQAARRMHLLTSETQVPRFLSEPQFRHKNRRRWRKSDLMYILLKGGSRATGCGGVPCLWGTQIPHCKMVLAVIAAGLRGAASGKGTEVPSAVHICSSGCPYFHLSFRDKARGLFLKKSLRWF